MAFLTRLFEARKSVAEPALRKAKAACRLLFCGVCYGFLFFHHALAEEKLRLRRVVVESTSIASLGYNQTRGVLEIEFRNGRTYRYTGVPKGVQQKFRAAESKGKFYHEFIRGHYRCAEIAPSAKSGR